MTGSAGTDLIELRIAILGLEHAREKLSLARKHNADAQTLLACQDDMKEAHERLQRMLELYAVNSPELPLIGEAELQADYPPF